MSRPLTGVRATASTWCRVLLVALWPMSALAEDLGLSLGEAILLGMDATPEARADAAGVRALDARVAASRAGLLPDLNVAGAATSGTGNVVAGGLYVPAGLPTVSGPPLDVSLAPGWQAQGSATLRWDLLGLAGRVRALDEELAGREAALARVEAARQARALQAGLAWLDAAEARERVGVAEADLERAQRVFTRAEALAGAGVRPGVERSLAAADVAGAEQRVARARGGEAAALARVMGELGGQPVVALAAAPSAPPGPLDVTPTAVRVAEAEIRRRAAVTASARAAFLPRFDLLGSAWVRAGSWPPGSDTRVAPNWTAGVVLELPLLDLPAQSATLREARAEQEAADHRADAVRVGVQAQVAEAEALLSAARAADAQSGAMLGAAREARSEAEARFGAGLVDLTLVAIGLQREREAELAALGTQFDVLRAALLRDAARGDLTPWTQAAQ